MRRQATGAADTEVPAVTGDLPPRNAPPEAGNDAEPTINSGSTPTDGYQLGDGEDGSIAGTAGLSATPGLHSDRDSRVQEIAAGAGASLHTYLPLLTRAKYSDLYDDFENSFYDDSFNPYRWMFGGDSGSEGNIFRAYQQDGVMVFDNSAADRSRAAGLGMVNPKQRSLAEVQIFEARLKLGGQRTGGWSETSLLVISNDVSGHGWLVQFGVGGRVREPQATPFCNISTNRDSDDWPPEYITYDPFAVAYDTWHTLRIETNPTTAEFRFFLDGKLFGSYVPKDAQALLTVENLEPMIHVYAGDPDTTAVHWVDDVKISPVQQPLQ